MGQSQKICDSAIYPEPEKGERGNTAANTKETLGFSTMYLSMARTVLRHSVDGPTGLTRPIARVAGRSTNGLPSRQRSRPYSRRAMGSQNLIRKALGIGTC